ncbi:MAG: WXG100 family type VII secretion target [Pseudonocardiaceae bacterium]
MTASGGFTADLPGIEGLAGFARDRAEDVRDIVQNLQRLPQANDDSLGDEALDAYHSFFGAWMDELNIIANSLDEIRQKFQDTADHYRANEVHWSHNFPSIEPPFVELPRIDRWR